MLRGENNRPGGRATVDERFGNLDQRVSASALLGYLNFSEGRPDPRWQRQLNEAFALLAERGGAAPWQALYDWLSTRLEALRAEGAAAFRDVTQARAVLDLALGKLLRAYRRHHADLLGQRSDAELLQPFFLARAVEAVLAQGGPWDEEERTLAGALARLNDFVGYRPLAVLETRPRGEVYDHERVRPIPLFLRGAGVAWGNYRELLARALDILAETDPALLAEAEFDLQLLDELAVDPRAYDHGHPVNRRPNYVFGEWDPHHIDNQGRYRRFVTRPVVLDALLERVEQAGGRDRGELLVEAAAVLAGTMLMAAGISGSGPTAHDSGATLARLMPGIARCRETFYARLLERVPGAHGERLRQEVATTRQPFGGARQHLNQVLARQRATQLQQRFLALLFADMGYPDAGRRAAAHIPAASLRLFGEVLARLATIQHLADRGEPAAAAPLLAEAEDLLQRGIACGAFADPWNVLGFQGLFPLSPAREDSVRDTRVDDLLGVVEQLFRAYARLLSEAAARGEEGLVAALTAGMRRLATWWDRFATVEVSGVRRVHGGEATASAEHVAGALARWHERGEAAADLAFWRQHLEGFRSPKAFALVVDALLRKADFRAALALLMSWLGQVEQVPLDDGEHSFHSLALRWMLGVSSREGSAAWPLVTRFLDHLEANAEDYWEVPSIGPEVLPMPREAEADDEEDLYGAAYEDVTYRDSADDEQEGSVADGGTLGREFVLEGQAEPVAGRLRFLSTVARLWMLAAREAARQPEAPGRAEHLAGWLAAARTKEEQLLALLDALHACPIPEPLGAQEAIMEYDRRRLLKLQLLHQAIVTCLDAAMAVGALRGALGQAEDSPSWEPWAIRLEQAVLQGDPAEARALLPRFLAEFRQEPLLFVPLEHGGEPRQILRARLAQTVLQALVATLPRLGLLRETYHLLRAARAMEQAHAVSGRGMTEFNHLFEAAFQGVLEAAVFAADDWDAAHGDDRPLVEVVEALTRPFLLLWIEHSRSVQLSALEAVPSDQEWAEVCEFVRRYGGDLFHAAFMSLANLRGIVHQGVGAYLDHLIANPDPLHPIRLVEELDAGLARGPVERRLQLVLLAIVENYEEYRDYNTTVAQSDYGQNLHALLDFLRLKASYERWAWQLRPRVLAHEVLARSGRAEAAVLWQEAFAQATQELAAEHLAALARLEQTHGMRLGTVADRLREQFVAPLAVDRLCALVEPAMEEASGPGPFPSFARLEEELGPFIAAPSGVGLDVPAWLRRLEAEVQRARAVRGALGVLAESLLQVPERSLSWEELQQQLQTWEEPLGGGGV
jgi:hypothetical protein